VGIKSDSRFSTKFLFDFIAISWIFEVKIIQKHGVRISRKIDRTDFQAEHTALEKIGDELSRSLKTLISTAFRSVAKLPFSNTTCDGMSVAGT
jgi:hypothetical protein